VSDALYRVLVGPEHHKFGVFINQYLKSPENGHTVGAEKVMKSHEFG